MVRGEKLVASDGLEVALFPCDAMYLTPARDPDEHLVYSLDFLPRDTSGNPIVGMYCYAPFSGTIVYTGNDHNAILESDNPVHLADGSISYMRVLVAHSWIAPTLGNHFNQGDLFYQTGNYGQSTGEHLHLEVAKVGQFDRYWNFDGLGLYNGIHMWNGLYVNDTVLLRPKSYDWKIFQGGITPTGIKRVKRFPWVLYARKLRLER